MPFLTPGQVRASTKPDMRTVWIPDADKVRGSKAFRDRIKRRHYSNWPGPNNGLNYAALEAAKEFVCRVPHPTAYERHRKTEYRLLLLRWSRASYVDIRKWRNGHPTRSGALFHLDVIKSLLPDLIATVRKLEMEDQRDPLEKAWVNVIYDLDTPLPTVQDDIKKRESARSGRL